MYMCVGVSMDSVFDVDNESIPIEKRNGFSFQSLDEGVSKKNISSFFFLLCNFWVSCLCVRDSENISHMSIAS